MAECLSVKELERLASGSTPETEAAALRGHLRECKNCRNQLQECQANLEYLERARPALIQAGSSPPDETETIPGPNEPAGTAGGHIPDARVGEPGAPARKDGVLPSAIPGHDIIRELHRGGQGVVYEAVQHSTKRKVAVKVLLEGPYASPSAKRRFEREIELVASLKHPNIIAIFSSGSTNDGQHYYVMDYVRGVPLHSYVQEHNLGVRAALRLFACVCEAVHYAHQKGVIHRDLKPSNILVDAQGNAKVLDFGLAKMVGGSDASLVSISGQVVGTLPYLSPEQARGNPDEVDVRTDVYALGVILYQILTGRHPYPVTAPLAEVLRHITETPPTPPSKAWVAEHGITRDAAWRLGRSSCPIDDEVQTIVLKALAKDRERRYQSVSELGRDIQHYLEGRPIEAKRDSGWYLARKFARRHRTGLTAAAMVTLIAGVSLCVLALQCEQLARRQAVVEWQEARETLAGFAMQPAGGFARMIAATPPVRRHIEQLAARQVESEATPERLVGAVAGPLANPDAFWRAVDHGPLWRHGEWLAIRFDDGSGYQSAMERVLESRISTGTACQKYVAVCLLGRLRSPASGVSPFEQAVRAGDHPGIVAAAWWAARRLGHEMPWPSHGPIVPDDISGLAFVRVPESPAFRRGSPQTDPDRRPDEDQPARGVPIKAFYLSTTEVTLAALALFVSDPANADLFGPFDAQVEAQHPDRVLAATRIRQDIQRLSKEDAGRTAAGWLSLHVARRYGEWLTRRAANAGLARRYRLPTEEEWEWACRGGSTARFCYGDGADYAAFFANCNGAAGEHRVAERMPNFYGFFDMHGGLWEWCESKYPAELVTDTAVMPEQRRELYVLRGGAFYSPAVRCRSAQRNYGDVHSPGQYWGARIVMELNPP